MAIMKCETFLECRSVRMSVRGEKIARNLIYFHHYRSLPFVGFVRFKLGHKFIIQRYLIFITPAAWDAIKRNSSTTSIIKFFLTKLESLKIYWIYLIAPLKIKSRVTNLSHVSYSIPFHSKTTFFWRKTVTNTFRVYEKLKNFSWKSYQDAHEIIV